MRKKIHKVCVANRGEIACRVIKACQNLGIKTVAVYSDVDANTRAVKMADEAVTLVGITALETYLNIEKIINAAKKSGCDALHPGYGFLSENHELSLACEKAGIIFIGPKAESIKKMGLKNVARDLAKSMGVPIVPGFNGEEQSIARFKKEAAAIGYPVLIKAAAGGGGKGMIIVEKESELESAFNSAKRSAKNAFGNDTLLLEKYFRRIKHIEIQILGDSHGKILHLFERECSVQRRHQKIIEETPSLVLTPEVRMKMGSAAVKIAESVNYEGAGTIEFILDVSSTDYTNFYFLEMNTRIQVEHPITEEVTGVDLVEWQIKIAEGAALPFNQSDLKQSGHAVECRIYAEDSQNNFMPSSGKIHHWKTVDDSYTRIDHGILNGDEVSVFYDPMLAKVITRGSNRSEAIEKMLFTLSKIELLGLTHNQTYLSTILKHPRFIDGLYDTNFILNHGDEIKTSLKNSFLAPTVIKELAVAAFLKNYSVSKFSNYPMSWRNNFAKLQKVSFEIKSELVTEPVTLLFRQITQQQFEIKINSDLFTITVSQTGWEMDGRHIQLSSIDGKNGEIFIHHPTVGNVTLIEKSRFPETKKQELDNSYLSPIPGKIVKMLVKAGDQINPGDELIIIESMKMENAIVAKKAGKIQEIFVQIGQLVEKQQQLLNINN